MDWATSATVAGPGNSFTEPSGSLIFSLTSSRPRSDQDPHRRHELAGLGRQARGFFRLRLGQRKIIRALAGVEEALVNAAGTLIEQSGLDQRLVNRRANTRVLHEVPAADQQDRARRIKGSVVGAIDRKVVSAGPQFGPGGLQRIGGFAQPNAEPPGLAPLRQSGGDPVSFNFTVQRQHRVQTCLPLCGGHNQRTEQHVVAKLDVIQRADDRRRVVGR